MSYRAVTCVDRMVHVRRTFPNLVAEQERPRRRTPASNCRPVRRSPTCWNSRWISALPKWSPLAL